MVKLKPSAWAARRTKDSTTADHSRESAGHSRESAGHSRESGNTVRGQHISKGLRSRFPLSRE